MSPQPELHVRVYRRLPDGGYTRQDVWYRWKLVREEDWPQRVRMPKDF